MAMGSKFDNAQKAAIVADYALLNSYNKVGQKYGISPNTVKRFVKEDNNLEGLCALKKAETTQTVLEYIEAQGNRVKKGIDAMLDRMTDPDAVAKLSAKDAAIVYGVLIDKQGVLQGNSPITINVTMGDKTSVEMTDYGN